MKNSIAILGIFLASSFFVEAQVQKPAAQVNDHTIQINSFGSRPFILMDNHRIDYPTLRSQLMLFRESKGELSLYDHYEKNAAISSGIWLGDILVGSICRMAIPKNSPDFNTSMSICGTVYLGSLISYFANDAIAKHHMHAATRLYNKRIIEEKRAALITG